jgi:aminopeptidase-like protein
VLSGFHGVIAGDRDSAEGAGAAMHALVTELYPICRSITGNGVRQTLEILGKALPLEVHEVPSGTRVFDWTVPREWNIRDAYVKGPDGRRIIDFQRSNLHVVSYSVPVRARMTLAELKPHLFARPDWPEVVPYRTSYYKETWGFCLSQRQLDEMIEGEYEVAIDSSLKPGSLTYGEYYLPGASDDEVLLSCHICHPSLANDNLSAVAVAAWLVQALAARPSRRYSYRFLFIPGTIGSITWLAHNEARVSHVKHGLILAGLGAGGGFTYKKSRRGDAEVDRAVAHVLAHAERPCSVVEFSPYGYDERQFCSPGFNMPVGCLMRAPHGQYREYHTSADDLDFVAPAELAGALETCLRVVDVLEGNARYANQNPKCEPQLGRRGLYRSLGGELDDASRELAMLWVLNLSDGGATLLDIADRSGLPFGTIKAAADALVGHGLLQLETICREL